MTTGGSQDRVTRKWLTLVGVGAEGHVEGVVNLAAKVLEQLGRGRAGLEAGRQALHTRAVKLTFLTLSSHFTNPHPPRPYKTAIKRVWLSCDSIEIDR